MFCTSDREFMRGVEMDDLWDGVKGRAVLSQHVLPVFALSQLHVHEALAAPGCGGGGWKHKRNALSDEGDRQAHADRHVLIQHLCGDSTGITFPLVQGNEMQLAAVSSCLKV